MYASDLSCAACYTFAWNPSYRASLDRYRVSKVVVGPCIKTSLFSLDFTNFDASIDYAWLSSPAEFGVSPPN